MPGMRLAGKMPYRTFLAGKMPYGTFLAGKMPYGMRAAAVATLAVALMALIGIPRASASSPAQADMAELMKSEQSSGLIGTSWWQAAVAQSTLEAYQQATGDTEYGSAISTAFADNKSGHFENSYMDDTGWWGNTWLTAYQMTGLKRYLYMAETDATYIHGYWDSTCGGGVWWNTSKTYKNAIPNELFLELTAGLHNALPGDTKFLGWANSEWTWFQHSGMINGSDLVNDGLNISSTGQCTNNGGTTWTYNQGVILAGLTELYQATGDSSLLTTAQGIADAAILHLNAAGVLNEPCTSCDTDQESFKGIFARGLKELSNALNTQEYASFFENQVNSIIPNDINSSHQMGFLWQGPIETLTSYSQASAEDGLVAGLSLGNNGTVLAQAGSNLCLDDYGSGQTAGNKIDVWACNSTPAQSWSTPAPTATGEIHVLNGCATVSNSTANGTKVVWGTCTGSPQQEWTWRTSGSTLYNAWSGKCMDNTGNSSTNGNPVQIWSCINDSAQIWRLP